MRHVASYPKVEQKWTQVPSRCESTRGPSSLCIYVDIADNFRTIVYFVDETEEIRAFYTLQTGETHYPFTAPRAVKGRSLQAVASPRNAVQELPNAPYLLDVLSPPETTTLSPSQSATGSRIYSALPPGSALGLTSCEDLNHAILPFRNATEVRLMKYYLEHMCHWVRNRTIHETLVFDVD